MSRPRGKRCPYELLGVERNADVTIIKTSYRKLAVKWHPDKNPGNPEAEAQFKEISEAYEILSDSDKRAAYDRYGHAAFEGMGAARGGGGFQGFHDPFDIFNEFVGAMGGGGGIFEQFFGGGRRSAQTGHGSDLRYDMNITLEEAAFGVEKEIEIRKLDTCDSCGGTGGQHGARAHTCHVCRGRGQVMASHGFFQVARECSQCHGAGEVIDKPCRPCSGQGRKERTSRMKVKIPPGIDEGNRLRNARSGEAGLRGAPAGDLHVVIHIKRHDIFERDGADLHCEMPLPFATAALGGEVHIPALGGTTETLKIPAGTQGASIFRVKGQGMAILHGHGRRGDLHVHARVEVPTRLNREQREALEKFSTLCSEENTPLHRTFMKRVKEFFNR